MFLLAIQSNVPKYNHLSIEEAAAFDKVGTSSDHPVFSCFKLNQHVNMEINSRQWRNGGSWGPQGFPSLPPPPPRLEAHVKLDDRHMKKDFQLNIGGG